MLIKSRVIIYTDGACKGNPGPGGWAAILIHKDKKKSISGGEQETTNNRMELLATIKALESLKKACNVDLFTDSKYVCNGITQWIHSWIKNNWKTSAKKPVKNEDLWQRLHVLDSFHNVNWQWVKGHSTNTLNNEVDRLASNAACFIAV